MNLKCYKIKKQLKLFIWLGVLLLSNNHMLAQKHPAAVTGTVLSERGETLSGVSITARSASPGTKESLTAITDEKGGFHLGNLIAGNKYDINFSFVGYEETVYRGIAASSEKTSSLTVHLKEKNAKLNEVVVTALGIKREQKALGYAAQSLGEKAVSDARSNNWSNALSGKVAGLSMFSTGSGPINSTRISLRGDNSMNPNGNNALIVLDGVPLNNGGTTSGVSSAYGAGSGNDVPVDFGNGISDINPDDIESITVLKGPGATALYGSRAANGALLVTTKSGVRKEKGLGVTVNSNFSMNDVLQWPDFQHEYGQGTGKALNSAGEKYYSYGNSADGVSTGGTSSAFGPKFDGQMYYQYDPTVNGQSKERQLWRPYTDNVKGFFRIGYTITNSVSLEGGNENGSARASVTHSKNEWIMPNTGYERITAAFSANYKVSDRIRVNAKVNYTNKKSDNLPATGYNNQSISYFMIFQNPNVDLAWYRPIWKPGQEQIDQIHPFSSFIDNPYLIAYEMTNGMNSHGVVGSLSATYDISKQISVMVRSGIDLASEDRQQRRPYSSANYKQGYYKEQSIARYEINSDVLLSYKNNLGRKFKISASAGANAMVRRYNRIDGTIVGLVIPGVYKLGNGLANPTMLTVDANKNVNSVYGTAGVSFKEKVFLDATGRNDWSSTLPVANNSFFYPSLNASVLLSELLPLPAQISFMKARLSVAQVGNDTDPYKNKKYYGASDFASSASVPTTLHNVDFKPEISTSYEAGLDIRMFMNRLGLDATVYRNFTKNQILDVPLDYSTGYSRATLNGGKVRNQGIELVLNGQPMKTRNLSWNTTITWARNWNRVLSLTEGMDEFQVINNGGNVVYNQAKIGGSTGDLYGFGFLRSPGSQIIYNATSGLPERPAQMQYIGNAYADWRGGVRNEFSYKNFRASILFDGQYGGIVYSQTHHKMTEQGKLEHTLRGREENYIIGEGVVMGSDGKYVPNTKKVLPVDYYADYYRRANVESNSFDASFLKLREARIEYNFSKKLLSKTPFKGATVALYGRDLAMWTDFPMFDPEAAALNGATIMPGVEIGQLPSTRTFGANVTMKF